MPRSMSEKYESAYRVVIEIKRDDGTLIYANYYGPYAKAGTARGVLAKELSYHERHRPGVGAFGGWVEKSSASWERVA